jgi:hypothetical protein
MRISITLICCAAFTTFATAMLIGPAVAPVTTLANTLPSQISDAEFWRIVTDFSEPTGPYPLRSGKGSSHMLQTMHLQSSATIPASPAADCRRGSSPLLLDRRWLHWRR